MHQMEKSYNDSEVKSYKIQPMLSFISKNNPDSRKQYLAKNELAQICAGKIGKMKFFKIKN